jgi:hypothetical protein
MSDDETTRIITRRHTPSSADLTETIPLKNASNNDDDPHTRIFRPSKSNTEATQGAAATNQQDLKIDPVVGWLVIIEGPGKGEALKLGYGMNSIGRSREDRVSLDFGDEEISRRNHAMVTFDPRGRKFYVQHGGGTNLTYLGDTPVLQPHELKGREIIGIGNTRLSFIPFCGETFDWQDL